MDLLCPDCAGDWPVMGQLLEHYGNRISLILHTFPLPYHTFAFRAAQGAHVDVRAHLQQVAGLLQGQLRLHTRKGAADPSTPR